MIKCKTAKGRFRRALQSLWDWCHVNRHQPIQDQYRKLRQKVTGHYAYYGTTGNENRLSAYLRGVRRAWKYWLARRDRDRSMTWSEYQRLERCYPLPPVRIVHRC